MKRSTHTEPKKEVVTIYIGRDDESMSVIVVNLEVILDNVITEYHLPASFDKEMHGMWQMELTQQLREAGYNTEEI